MWVIPLRVQDKGFWGGWQERPSCAKDADDWEESEEVIDERRSMACCNFSNWSMAPRSMATCHWSVSFLLWSGNETSNADSLVPRSTLTLVNDHQLINDVRCRHWWSLIDVRRHHQWSLIDVQHRHRWSLINIWHWYWWTLIDVEHQSSILSTSVLHNCRFHTPFSSAQISRGLRINHSSACVRNACNHAMTVKKTLVEIRR